MKGGNHRQADLVFQFKKEKKTKDKRREYSIVVLKLIYISVFISVYLSSSFVNWQVQFTGSPLLYAFNLYHRKKITQDFLAKYQYKASINPLPLHSQVGNPGQTQTYTKRTKVRYKTHYIHCFEECTILLWMMKLLCIWFL